jgi:phosphoribosylformylglycinamidine synthase I
MSQPIGVVRFLGTNCDQDVFQAVKLAGLEPEWVWYQDQFDKSRYAALILPGGFSYGDYLRCGALAARSPVMKSVREAASYGTPVLGICNGFQILCEAGLLPGALLRNNSLRFRDGWVRLRLTNVQKSFSGTKLKEAMLPVAHGEGRYYIEEDQVKKLFDDEQVWWTYEQNPNGSIENIAGVMNDKKNVAALMPHPERAVAEFMGGTDGLNFFTSLM